MSKLGGQIALVTGAGQGLGKAIALELAACGAYVLVNDLSRAAAETTAAEIKQAAGQASPVVADISSEADVLALFSEIRCKQGRLDILVNNAGTAQSKDIFEITLADWERILRVNLTGTFLCSKQAMLIMREQRQGRIVNIASIAGQRGALFGHVHYASTKSGLLGFSKTLARTGAPFGITVNTVAPGIIETELLMKTHGREEVAALAASVPLGLGQPRDVALAVAFLCGEGGRFITGATLDVNGGMNMR